MATFSLINLRLKLRMRNLIALDPQNKNSTNTVSNTITSPKKKSQLTKTIILQTVISTTQNQYVSSWNITSSRTANAKEKSLIRSK